MESPSKATIHYDADCGLCQRSVAWVRRRDPQFRFQPLDRDSGSVVVESGGVRFTESEAVLQILIHMGGGYAIAAKLARLIPRALRDAIYRWIALNRHRWFPAECQPARRAGS